jgi:hypothetical protein
MGSQMKCLALASLVGSVLVSPALAGNVERTCAGILTDMRTIGVQLDGCDLNSISESEFKRITDVCGSPGGIDETPPTCRLRAIVSPHRPNQYGTGFVDIVQKVLNVSKGSVR